MREIVARKGDYEFVYINQEVSHAKPSFMIKNVKEDSSITCYLSFTKFKKKWLNEFVKDFPVLKPSYFTIMRGFMISTKYFGGYMQFRIDSAEHPHEKIVFSDCYPIGLIPQANRETIVDMFRINDSDTRDLACEMICEIVEM